MGGLSLVHWIVIGLVFVLLFGTKKLPELGSGLGQAITNFKKTLKDAEAIDVTTKDASKDAEKKDSGSAK